MNPKPMRLIRRQNDEPTRQEIEMAHIEQTWAEWIGPNGHSWKPITQTHGKKLDIDSVLRRSYRKTDQE